MRIRTQPVVDLWVLYKAPKILIFQHILRIQQQPIRQIARQNRRVRLAQQDLPAPRINPISTNNQIRRPPLPIRQYSRSLRRATGHIIRVLDISEPGIRLDLRPELNGAIQKRQVQTRAMEVPERGPGLLLVLVEVHVADLLALPSQHVALLGPRRELGEDVLHAPGDEHARAVGQALDAGAYFADFGRGFEDRDGVA